MNLGISCGMVHSKTIPIPSSVADSGMLISSLLRLPCSQGPAYHADILSGAFGCKRVKCEGKQDIKHCFAGMDSGR